MYYPKRNLTLEELERTLAGRIFKTDKSTIEGKNIIKSITILQNKINIFTPDILSENFTTFSFSSREEMSVKIQLRINGYYAALYAGDIDMSVMEMAVNGFVEILEDVQYFIPVNSTYFPHVTVSLETWEIFIEEPN